MLLADGEGAWAAGAEFADRILQGFHQEAVVVRLLPVEAALFAKYADAEVVFFAGGHLGGHKHAGGAGGGAEENASVVVQGAARHDGA